MPKIGLRIIKSSVAVALCFLVYFLRGQQGTPFYSAIAAVLCMQPDTSNSLKVGWNRTVGTLIGGFCGMLVLLVERYWLPPQYPALPYLVTAAAIIPLIYATLLVKKPTASYITCVVFMSITVSHGADINPYLFAFNRTLDTLIGIFVSLAVNNIRLFWREDRENLLALDLGRLFQVEAGKQPYVRVHLKRLLERGARVAFFTQRSPAYLMRALGGVKPEMPVVVLGGSALYRVAENRYEVLETLPRDEVPRLLALFARQGAPCFAYTVTSHMLHVYCGEELAPAGQAYYEAERGTPYTNFVFVPLPERSHGEVLVLTAIGPEEGIEALAREAAGMDAAGRLNITVSSDERLGGLARLDVRGAGATVDQALALLQARVGAPAVLYPGQAAEDGACGTVQGLELLRRTEQIFLHRGRNSREKAVL